MIAANDNELMDWIFCLANQHPVKSGSFLEAIGRAAVCADDDNYAILRPVLRMLKHKYPQYGDQP